MSSAAPIRRHAAGYQRHQQVRVFRGPAGRTRAVAAAIRAGLANNEEAATIETRIDVAEAAGVPLTLW